MNSPATRSPEEFDVATLLASDFDRTVADTFEPAPSGIGVNEAYEIAVEEVFGTHALARYVTDGGHNNRSPGDIASAFAQGASRSELKQLADNLVAVKLGHLTSSIGKPMEDGELWPRLMPGFADTWRAASAAREEGKQLSTALISAGHAPFIEEVFSLYELEMPDMMVTDETVRGLYTNLPIEKLTKPHTMAMDIIRAQWLAQYSSTEQEKQLLLDTNPNERIVYVGDDEKKDGGLAKNAGVDFVLIEKQTSHESWKHVAAKFDLGAVAVSGAVNESPKE